MEWNTDKEEPDMKDGFALGEVEASEIRLDRGFPQSTRLSRQSRPSHQNSNFSKPVDIDLPVEQTLTNKTCIQRRAYDKLEIL